MQRARVCRTLQFSVERILRAKRMRQGYRRQNPVQSSSRLCLNLLPIGFDAKRVWKMPKTMPYKTAITGFHLRCIACPRLQAVDS